jgi:NAD(P)-dependent dehydrogenase (short-subunit alcohol dehydrogenase family)
MDKFLTYKKFLNIKIKKKKNRTAVITGGCGRIGSIFTSQLLYENYEVICLSKTNKKYLDFRKNLPNRIKKNIHWYPIDLLKPNTINDAINYIFKKFSKLDILINNAADSNRGKNYNYNIQSLEKEFWGTFGSSFYLTEKILPFLRKQKSGKIINTGSLWGSHAAKFKTYSNLDIGPSPIIASGKAAIMQYTKHLASREAEFNIVVNALIPGWFPRKGPVENKKYINSIKSNIPLNRIGKLEDLVTSVEFLLSEKSNYMTGQFLIIDGGYSIW